MQTHVCRSPSGSTRGLTLSHWGARSERSERSPFLLVTNTCKHMSADHIQDLPEAPEMRPRSERSERSTFILRTYYVLITYYLACCLLEMCVILALSWRDVCMVVAWDSLATWFAFGGTVFEKLMFAYVFTSTYSYPDLSRSVQNCSNGPPPTERMKRAEYVRLIYVLRTNHLLFTYLLLT